MLMAKFQLECLVWFRIHLKDGSYHDVKVEREEEDVSNIYT